MAKETTCDNLPNLNNGTISQGQKNVGAQRTIQCNSGFDLRGAASITCLNNGQWTIPGTCHISESCVKVNILNYYITIEGACRIPPPVVNGQYDSYATAANSQRGIICNAGFMIVGNSGIFCLSDGTWSPSGRCVKVPTTVQTRCGSPPQVSNGRFSSGSDYIGSVRSLTCDFGYEINGGNEITCKDNGQWTNPGICHISESCIKVNILNILRHPY